MSDVGIFTAQNISINFKVAGLGDRIAAFAIDAFVILAYILLVNFIVDMFFRPASGVLLTAFMYLPVFLYHLLFEYLMNGQSPGKKQMKIRILHEEGSPATIGSYLLRWILSPIDFLLSGGIAMITIIMTQKGQRLGDLAAGTIVVKEKKLDQYNKDFMHHRTETDHQVLFPTVKHRILQQDIDMIKETLKVRIENQVHTPAEKIRKVIEKKLDVQTDLSTVDFLHKVIKDFNFIHSDEAGM